MGGAPLPVIAKQLGHADTRITEKHYAHLAPELRRRHNSRIVANARTSSAYQHYSPKTQKLGKDTTHV